MHTFGRSMSAGQIAKSVVLAVLLIAIVMAVWPGRSDPNSSDPNERLQAIAELDGRTDDESIKTLVALAGDPKPHVATAAVKAIGAYPKLSPAPLRKILASKKEDPQMRAGAARGLARRRDKTALKELVEALEDPDARVRLWAITAIGRTTAFRFKFDAFAPPAKQQNEIRFIKDTLRRRTAYK